MGIFLLDVHGWQVLPANSVKWEWFTPFSALTYTVMVMTVAIYWALTGAPGWLSNFFLKERNLLWVMRKTSWLLATSYLTELKYDITMNVQEEKNNCWIPAIYTREADSCGQEISDVFLRDGVVKPKCKFTKYNRITVKKSQWPYLRLTDCKLLWMLESKTFLPYLILL